MILTIAKMSSALILFHDLPAGAIKTLFDEQNQPLFNRADSEVPVYNLYCR